jgi:hypothetical protein
LTQDVHVALADLAAGWSHDVAKFDTVERRDGMVWLVPADQRPFLRLTAEVVAQWPDCPPYEGIHDELIAHLTLVETPEVQALDAARVAATASCPFSAAITGIRVIVEDGAGRWHTRWRLPFGRRAAPRRLDP